MDAKFYSHRLRYVLAGVDGILRTIDSDNRHPSMKVIQSATGFSAPAIGRLSDDGRLLAAVDNSGAVRVWNLATGSMLHRHAAAEAAIAPPFAWHPANELLAVIQADNSIGWWNVHTGEVTDKLAVELRAEGRVASVELSPDGKQVAIGTQVYQVGNEHSGRITLFDAQSKEPLVTYPETPGIPGLIVFSPDGTRIASIHGDAVYIWDASKPEQLQVLRGHVGLVTWIAFSPDGQRLASAGWDRTVKVWDLSSGFETITLRGHKNIVTWVRFQPEQEGLASAAIDDGLKVWRAAPELAPVSEQLQQEAQDLYRRVWQALELARQGHTAQALSTADVLAGETQVSPVDLYNLACTYAVCSAKVREQDVATAEQAGSARQYEDRAVEMLRWSINTGLLRMIQIEQLQQDPDLDAVRPRTEFQALLRNAQDTRQE